MARIGTAYIEVSGDFSAFRRQLAVLGREQGAIQLKVDVDKTSVSRAKGTKEDLGRDEKFTLAGVVDRSSFAKLQSEKKVLGSREEFHLAGAIDLSSFARAEAAKETLGGEEEVKVRADVDVASFAKAIAAEMGLQGATTAVVKESGALSDVFNRSSLSIGQMVGLFTLAAPVVLDLAGALTALAGSAAAATAGLGALAIGGAGVGAVGLGGILAIAGPAIGSLKDLMTAQEAANKSQATGAKAAGLATMQSAAQIKAAHQQVADATRGVTTAEGQLELAQESELLAQEALTQAREDATRQLQDMRRAAIEGKTAEDRAEIGLRQARESLNELLMSGTASALDLESAELSVTEARQNLRDVTIAGNRAQEDFNEAQRGGINQMSQVVAAQQSLDSAVRGVEDAQRGVADAHRQVARALENLELQQRQANQATVAGGASMAALARAQRKAGPEAVKFAETLKTLGRRWRGLTREGKTDFFRALNDGVDRLNRKLPLLAESANRSMRALRRGFNDFLDRATGPEFNHFIHVMTRTFAKSIGPISRAFGNIAKVLQRIAVAVAPDIVRMSKGFEDMTKGWLDSTKNAKALRETVHGLVEQAETWWGLVKAVGNVLGSLFASGMDEGKSAIQGITDQLNEWADWIDKNPKKMHDFFANGLETAKELAVTIGGFFETFVDLGNALRPIVRGFLDLIQGLNSIKLGNISALTALIGLFIAYKTAQGIARTVDNIRDFADRLSDLRTSMQGGRMAAAFERLRGWFSAVTGAASQVANRIADWAGTMVAQIRVKGRKIRDAIGRVMRAGRTFVTSAATSAAEWAGGLVSNIRSSRLSRRLGIIFKAIAVRLGKIMAASTAAAVVIGEGIGGAAASLGGVLRDRLPGRMRGAGRVSGRAFGVAFAAGVVLALPLLGEQIVTKIRDSLREAFTGKGGPFDEEAGRGIVGEQHGTPIGDAWEDFKGLFGQHGGLVTEMGIVPQGFQTGGIVGRRKRRPGVRDTVPAMLEVGELVIPKKMVDETRKSAKKTALVLTDELGEGYEKVSDDSKDFVKRHGKSMETLRKAASKQTEKFRKGTVDDFDRTGDSATDRTKRMRTNVLDGFAKMRSSSIEQTGKMKSGVGEDFRNMTGAVGDGLQKIASMTNNALRALGVKKVNFHIAEERGGRGPRRQTGGMVVPGKTTGDSVPVQAMVEPGEALAVLNRNAAKAWMTWNEKFPRFQGGGVVDRTGVRHFQRGGMQGPFQSRADVMGSGPGFIPFMNYLNSMFGPLNVISGFRPGSITTSGNLSNHSWGGAVDISTPGGEGATQSNPMTGALGRRMDAAHAWIGKHFQPMLLDFLWRTLVGGNHYNHIHAGIARAYSFDADKMSEYISRLPRGGGFARLKRVLLKGPDGPLKDIGQAALDEVRGGANQMLRRKQNTAGFGMGRAPNVEGFWTTSQLEDLWRATGSNGDPNLMARIGFSESAGGNPMAVSSAGARGLWQIMPYTWADFGKGSFDRAFIPTANATAAHKILASQGLGAWDVWNFGIVRQEGGMVEPLLGSFKDGGFVQKTGPYHLHEGETVIPEMKQGGMLEDRKNFLQKRLAFLLEKRDSSDKLVKLVQNMRAEIRRINLKLVHESNRPRPSNEPDPRHDASQGGFIHQPRSGLLGEMRKERRRLQEELRDVIERDNLSRKHMDRLVDSINAQVEASKENTAQNKELHRAIHEHNKLYGDVKSSTATAVRGLSNFVANEVGHRGAQKTRNAGWGVNRRY